MNTIHNLRPVIPSKLETSDNFLVDKSRIRSSDGLDQSVLSIPFDVGKLDSIFFGPMYSGKTTKLLQRLTTCADVGLRVLYINHKDDVRQTESYNLNVTTHHSQFSKISEKIDTIKTAVLLDLNISSYDVIGIDEGQFFDDIPEAVRKWLLTDKKQIFIASLDGDANMKPFGRVNELICLCSPRGLYKLDAKCFRCLKRSVSNRQLMMSPAGFTHKIGGVQSESSQKDVGGSDKYQAVCLKCYQELNQNN